MFKIRFLPYLIFSICLLLSNLGFGQKQLISSKELIYKMIKSINEVERFKYSLKIAERGKKGYNHYESSVKLSKSPRRIYLYIKGIELLWVSGWNNNKAYVKPNSFPYINISLDPLGTLIRQDQHHTINEMGFDYFGGIVEFMALKVNDKFEQYFRIEGEERYNNRPCYKLIIDNKDYAFDNYTVGEKESITSIARKLHISEYKILEVNPKLNDFFDILKKGQILKVPNAYAKYVTLYIDQLYDLPIGVKVEDDKGLFEQYDYFFLQVNPKIDNSEFTTGYKDYKF